MMIMLITGVLVWSLVHFLPSLAPGLKRSIEGSLGENGYKGTFSLCMVAAILLMVFGWKSSGEHLVYEAPSWGGIVTFILMIGSAILFFAPYMKNSISAYLRHPQLLAVALFGIGHLVAVGHVRSLVLFGGLSLWALLEIPLIKRRDGPREPPGPASFRQNLILVVAGTVFFMVFLFTHEKLFGIAALPG